MKKILLSIILFCLTITIHTTDSLYHILGEKLLESSEQIAKTEEQNQNIFNEPKLQQEDPSKIKVETTIYDFTAHEKLHLTTQLLKALFPKTKLPSKDTLCSLQDLEKLAVFKGSASNKLNNVLATFPTTTSYGKIRLAELFVTTPTTKPAIEKRQKFVKKIASNTELRTQLQQALSLISNNEGFHYTFYKHDESFEKVVTTLSQNDSFIGNYPTIIQGIHILKSALVAYSVLPISIIGNTFIFKKYIDSTVTQKKFHFKDGNFVWTSEAALPPFYTLLAAGTLSTLNYALTLRGAYENFTQTQAIINNLYMRTKGFADTIRGLRILYTLVKNDPSIADHIEEVDTLKNLFEQTNNHDLSYLIQLLETTTFKDELSYFSHVGRIYKAYHLIHKLKKEFVSTLATAGMFDAYYAAAQLTLPDNDNISQYTYAHIIDSTCPILAIKECAHPLIHTTPNITHEICINEEQKNIHIAGPNGSGKSVLVSEIALAILEAHAFGIVKTTSTVQPIISCMNKLLTYLNVQEDLSKNLSTYMAQQMRFDEIMTEAEKAHQKGQNIIIIMDEPLTGASPLIAGPRVQEGALNLASYPEITTILASHYQELTLLQEESNNGFVTYYLDLIPSHDGTQFTRLFTLHKGQHPWWNINKDLTKNYLIWLDKESRKKYM